VTNRRKRLLKPVGKHAKLELVQEGVDYLNAIATPVATVFVVGKYRTGKSFLLNQLANLSCAEGFGVGHDRAAQTAGVWIYQVGDVLFVDTEGLSAPGALRAYDDRLTAFATLNAAIILYNLRETVEEADLERLSFGLELSEHLSAGGSYEPPALVWTVQQDFLQGDTLERAIEIALQPVDNPESFAHTAAINLVRERLRRVNSTHSVGLPQPHARRSDLCALSDADLDAGYLERRDELAQIVRHVAAAAPKRVGREVTHHARKTVAALNRGVFPTSFDVVEYFNQDVALKCLSTYEKSMGALLMRIPVSTRELEESHARHWAAAQRSFADLRFGRSAKTAFLDASIRNSFVRYSQTNANALLKTCMVLEDNCVAVLDGFGAPSLHWFDAVSAKCEKQYLRLCAHSKDRLERLTVRSRGLFLQS
jgi:hypothetical protein